MQEIALDKVSNVFSKIADDWFLITAGNRKAFNCMTASWGSMGAMWFKPVCSVVIRPSRYTFQFMEGEKVFTICFFDKTMRDTLQYCGSHSGKNIDKAKETGLTPRVMNNGGVAYEEADLVLECKKIYTQDIDPKLFVDSKIDRHYPKKDYHRMYVGEILACYEAI